MTPPKDKTSAKRSAELKKRLQSEGGKRLTVNLKGEHVQKLDQLIQSGVAADQGGVVRALIEQAKTKPGH